MAKRFCSQRRQPVPAVDEEAAKAQAQEEDRRAFGTSEPDSDASADASFERAVTLRFLLAFTIFHDCWEWPTWKVVQELVKPATAARRCRYAELPAIAACGAVGPADTFGSHCWGAKCAPPPRPSRRAPAALRVAHGRHASAPAARAGGACSWRPSPTTPTSSDECGSTASRSASGQAVRAARAAAAAARRARAR